MTKLDIHNNLHRKDKKSIQIFLTKKEYLLFKKKFKKIEATSNRELILAAIKLL